MSAWHPHPDVWLLVAALGAAYAAVARKAATRRQVTWFALGLVTILVSADWPLHEVAEQRWYSAHMVQHLLFTLVAAPLLLLGTPEATARRLLRPFMRVLAQLTRPLPALVIFNTVIVITHWPLAVEAGVRSEALHFATHAVLVGSALLMWWPVTSSLPELPRLSRPGAMLYMFLQSIVPTVPASFLTFGGAPLYKIYETFPRMWGIDALTDMRIAGLIMKLAGGAILWIVIAVQFFRWHAEEQTPGWDALQFRDVERDVRAGMNR